MDLDRIPHPALPSADTPHFKTQMCRFGGLTVAAENVKAQSLKGSSATSCNGCVLVFFESHCCALYLLHIHKTGNQVRFSTAAPLVGECVSFTLTRQLLMGRT